MLIVKEIIELLLAILILVYIILRLIKRKNS